MTNLKKNNIQTVTFESKIYLKEIDLDEKFVSLLESIKLKKYPMNENNYYDNEPEDKTFLVYKYIEPYIHEITNSKFTLLRWWIQKYKKENYHDLHTHGYKSNGFSFILYLKSTPKSAKTIFYGPGYPLIDWKSVEVKPKPGLLVLFPSYIPHSAGYNKDTKRLILSGNIEI